QLDLDGVGCASAFQRCGLPVLLAGPWDRDRPGWKMASVAPCSIPRMRSADFYRILSWPIKLGKTLLSSSVCAGAKRAPYLPLERERARLSASAVPSGEHRWHWYLVVSPFA